MAAIAAYIATGCQVEERFLQAIKAPDTNQITVNFTASENLTKAAFGEFDESTQKYPTFWTAADTEICMSLNMDEPIVGEVIKTDEISATADFVGTFNDTGAPYKFYALTPSSVVNGISESRSSWSVTIPTIQTPKADGLSCDENAMLLFAESDVLDALPESTVRMHMRHVPAYCRLALKNLDVAFTSNGIADPVVKSVDVSYSTPVAGNWYINVSDGSLEAKDASHTITIRASVSDLSQPTDLWFALAPAVLDGQKVKVTVNTDKGSLSREYTYGTRTYVAGTINKLSLDMTKNSTFTAASYTFDETVYELVTSVNSLSVNDEVIIVDSPIPELAMSKTFSSTAYESVMVDAADGFTYSESDGYVRLAEGSNAMVWTISSKSGNSVTFKSGSSYLAKTGSGTSTYFTTVTNSSRAQAFTLYDFNDAQFAAYCTSKSGSTTYYHSIAVSTANRFFLYTATGGNVAAISIFKKKNVTTTVGFDLDSDPILENSIYGAYLSGTSILYVPGTTQLSREYDGDDVTFSILKPSENTVVEMSGIPSNAMKGDTFSLVVRQIKGSKTTSIQTYNVTVVMEEGPKLWLTDLGGNGFIVKR